MEKKFYLGKNDVAFRLIFGDPDNTPLLKSFIERILKITTESITIVNPNVKRKRIIAKDRTVDLLVETNDNRIIHIELNNGGYDYYHPRNFSYFTSIMNNSIKRGDKYNAKFIKEEFIHIDLSYNLSKEYDICESYKLRSDSNPNHSYIDNFKIVEYNMSRLMEEAKTNKKLVNEYIMLIMLGLNEKELKDLGKEDVDVAKFYENLERVNNTSEYIPFLSAEEDEKFIKNSLISEGEEKGLKKGRKSMQIETAKAMLKDNVPIETISKYTKLSSSDLQKLSKN